MKQELGAKAILYPMPAVVLAAYKAAGENHREFLNHRSVHMSALYHMQTRPL